MIIAIHQPNYIPWIGYFHKIRNCDLFVILDNVQHSKASVTTRNKIKSANGEILLTVPVINKGSIINELFIDNSRNWSGRHWRSIHENYCKAVGWNYMEHELESIYSRHWDYEAELNIELIKLMMKKLNIKTPITLASDIKNDFGTKSTRVSNICKYFNADTYLSGNGARSYNDEEEFERCGIRLVYQQFKPPIYDQMWGEFIPNLSALDLLLNCGESAADYIEKQII